MAFGSKTTFLTLPWQHFYSGSSRVENEINSKIYCFRNKCGPYRQIFICFRLIYSVKIKYKLVIVMLTIVTYILSRKFLMYPKKFKVRD